MKSPTLGQKCPMCNDEGGAYVINNAPFADATAIAPSALGRFWKRCTYRMCGNKEHYEFLAKCDAGTATQEDMKAAAQRLDGAK